LPRGNRLAAIRGYAAAFAKALEAQVSRTPLQWFNFYPFWNESSEQPHAAQEAAE